MKILAVITETASCLRYPSLLSCLQAESPSCVEQQYTYLQEYVSWLWVCPSDTVLARESAFHRTWSLSLFSFLLSVQTKACTPVVTARQLRDVSLLSKTMSRRKMLRYSWRRPSWPVLECQHTRFPEGEEKARFPINHYIWILSAIKYIYIHTDDILNTVKFTKKCVFAEFFCVYT